MLSVETVRTVKASGQEGAAECDVTGVKLLSMSEYPQRGEKISKCLSCQGNLTSSVPRLTLEVFGQGGRYERFS